MRHLLAFAALLGAVIVASSAAGAVDGHAGPVTLHVTPTNGLADGQAVSIRASVPSGVRIYELRAHLCVPGRALETNFDFGFQGRRCTNLKVGRGDIERSAAFGEGTTNATLDGFHVGEGRVHWVNELGFDQTIQCDATHPCDLVVRAQITDDTVFYSAPLCFGPACKGTTGSEDRVRTPLLALAGVVVGALLVFSFARRRKARAT
jgi:hypothetical protein